MATYAIGDVQGCYDSLLQLLEKIDFDSQQDQLWLVGDLVNRGNQSLEVLRFIKNLKNAKVVLGNHDIHLLALASGKKPHTQHTLHSVLSAPDREELLAWVRALPFLYYDAQLNYVMTHAGIYPQWNLQQAQQYAQELEIALRNEPLPIFISHIYGNQPEQWQESLTGWARLRFIMNAFTRMRFCSLAGKLEFNSVEGADKNPEGFLPWFKIPRCLSPKLNRLNFAQKIPEIKIIFGHWAALQGVTNEPHVFALDTGCVWGNCLTAMRLEDQQRFSVSCASKT